MPGNAKQKRKTRLRKVRQAEERYVSALRREAVRFEGVTQRRAARMSRESLEETLKRGKKRRNPSIGIGYPLAFAAANLLRAKGQRR